MMINILNLKQILAVLILAGLALPGQALSKINIFQSKCIKKADEKHDSMMQKVTAHHRVSLAACNKVKNRNRCTSRANSAKGKKALYASRQHKMAVKKCIYRIKSCRQQVSMKHAGKIRKLEQAYRRKAAVCGRNRNDSSTCRSRLGKWMNDQGDRLIAQRSRKLEKCRMK